MNFSFKSTTAVGAMVACMALPAWADMEAAMEFLDNEIAGLSVLDRAAQEAEMQFFVDAAKPFQGMEIKVVSETITTHEYESQVLAPAFSAITGIQVTHDLIGEGAGCGDRCTSRSSISSRTRSTSAAGRSILLITGRSSKSLSMARSP